MRLVAISDTHCCHKYEHSTIPSGDVLLHAGDLTYKGDLQEIQGELEWIASLPFKHRLVIPGNHDFLFEKDYSLAKSLVPKGVTLLLDSGIEIDGVKFWGSPWQPEFYNWAFNLPRGEELAQKWALIPEGTDVLITHGPPRKKLDVTKDGTHVGCSDLARRIAILRPKLHVFGHIHFAHGLLEEEHTTFVNAAITDENAIPCQPPVVLDLYEQAGSLKIQVVSY